MKIRLARCSHFKKFLTTEANSSVRFWLATMSWILAPPPSWPLWSYVYGEMPLSASALVYWRCWFWFSVKSSPRHGRCATMKSFPSPTRESSICWCSFWLLSSLSLIKYQGFSFLFCTLTRQPASQWQRPSWKHMWTSATRTAWSSRRRRSSSTMYSSLVTQLQKTLWFPALTWPPLMSTPPMRNCWHCSANLCIPAFLSMKMKWITWLVLWS